MHTIRFTACLLGLIVPQCVSAAPVNGITTYNAATTMNAVRYAAENPCARGYFLASDGRCYRAHRVGCASGFVRDWDGSCIRVRRGMPPPVE